MRNASHLLIQLTLAIPVLLTLVPCASASAGAVTETARKWGLIGPWSQDCSLPPDHDSGTVLIYAIARGNHLMLRRDLGDAKDDNEVVGAEVSADGMLNLRTGTANTPSRTANSPPTAIRRRRCISAAAQLAEHLFRILSRFRRNVPSQAKFDLRKV